MVTFVYNYNLLNCTIYVGEIQEYCQLETYNPDCWKNEVIVIDEAIYGRRHIGKCITADDVYSEFADNPLYLGCSANVLHLLDAKCSGRQKCQVRIPDAELVRTKPCLKDLKMFLEVRYHCVEGKQLTVNLSAYSFPWCQTCC